MYQIRIDCFDEKLKGYGLCLSTISNQKIKFW